MATTTVNLDYDICSSRQCNVCLLLQMEKNIKMTPSATASSPKRNQASEYSGTLLQKGYLRKCNGCKLVLYCGVEHQKIDWPLHKEFCRGIQKIMKTYKIRHPYFLSGERPKTIYGIERAILQVKYLLRIAIGRELEFNEEEFTSFPHYCAKCFTFDGVQSCKNCLAVSYCSEAHAEQDAKEHKKICSSLKLYYCAYKVQPMAQDIMHKFFNPVKDLQNTDLIDTFQCVTQKKIPDDPTESLQSYQLFSTASDYSCIGTICYALSFLDMNSYENTKFVIFIVGATVERQLWFLDMHTKFFFLQYPQISNLELYFIGPQALPSQQQIVFYYFQGVQRTVLYLTYCSLFQDFITKNCTKPSIIVAFNCGFSEFAFMYDESCTCETNGNKRPMDPWESGLTDILQTYDLPIVFTSFTAMEADFDYSAVLRIARHDRLRIRVERIFNVQKNPFHDLRPLRKWHINDKEEIFYRNGYVQAIRSFIGV